MQPSGEWLTRQGSRVWHSATQRVMTVTALGMLMSLVVDVLIAVRLGTGPMADALIVGLSFPLFIDTVMREGTKFSLLTLFVQKDNTLSEDEYHDFVSGLLNLFLVVGLGLTALGWLLAPEVVAMVGPGLALEGKVQASLFLRLGVPLTLFALASNVLGVLLNSRQYFVHAAARNVVASTVVVVVIGLAWRSPRIPVWIAAAYTLGYSAFFSLLLWFSVVRIGFLPDWRAWPDRVAFRQLWWTIVYPVLGFSMRHGSRLVERMLASLVTSGGVSAYYFAFRLISAMQSLVGVSIAITGQPRLVQHDLAGHRDEFSHALRRRVAYAVLVSLPVAIGILLFHDQIVRLVYGRGAFGAASVYMTGQILLYLGGGLVFLCVIPVLISGLYAQRRYVWVFFNMAFAAVLNVLLAWWLFRVWQLVGIAVAVTGSALISVIILVLLLRKSGVRLDFGQHVQ